MMVMTVYDELIKEKGIALIRGDLINRMDLNKKDGILIMSYLREFYLNEFNLIKSFNFKSNEFQFNELFTKFKQFRINKGNL